MNVGQDVRQDVTNRVLAYIDAGTVPWRKAWTSASSRPINAKTQKPYSGVNSLLLGMAMFENANFASDNRFITGAQAHEMKLRIRAGERSVARVIRMVEVDRHKTEKESDGEVIAEENGKYLVMKTYAVFHASQLDPGLPPLVKTKSNVAPVAAVGAIVDALKESGLKIVEGPFEPCFIPKLDLIRIPPMSSYKGVDDDDVAASFFGTLLHEISHCVGAPKRLGRFGFSAMSLQERAMEEMVAEWSATLFCSDCPGIKLGDEHVRLHSSYLASWAAVLKSDKSAIFRAAAAAQKTCDYLEQQAAPKVTPLVVVQDVPAANEPVIQVSKARRKAGPR